MMRASELNWLGVHDLFLYLHSGDENKVDLTVGDATNLSTQVYHLSKERLELTIIKNIYCGDISTVPSQASNSKS
jgi:hypothetical protein